MIVQRINQTGFSLIEVIVVIVISGILLTVALGTGKRITDNARTEQTLDEMDQLAVAIVGEPGSYSEGSRTNFGYVGDVGALPPNLAALKTNPGSYSTWNGPYIENRFEQTTTDYQKDAWQSDYLFSGGTSLNSVGSGETITRQFAGSVDELLYNSLEGNLYDSDGDPPGSIFRDSITAILSYPNGSGGIRTVVTTPDMGGYFSFDSVPIGNHDLTLIYLPTNDTLKRFVTVPPGARVYEEARLPFSTWTSAGGGLNYVSGSAVITGASPHCNAFEFQVTNDGTFPVVITSMTFSWSSPVSYYTKLSVDGATLFSNQSPRNGTGDQVTFSSVLISPAQVITIKLHQFVASPTGGAGTKVDMSNTDITVTFSDGSIVTFNTGPC